MELLGGQLSAKSTRESLILKAKFLSSDLPYFAELLAEVASQTKFPGGLYIVGNVNWIDSV